MQEIIFFQVTSDLDIVILGPMAEKLLRDVSHNSVSFLLLALTFFFFFYFHHCGHNVVGCTSKNPFHIPDRTKDNRLSSNAILSFYMGKQRNAHAICQGGYLCIYPTINYSLSTKLSMMQDANRVVVSNHKETLPLMRLQSAEN